MIQVIIIGKDAANEVRNNIDFCINSASNNQS